MGLYLDPKDMSKKDWLRKHVTHIHAGEAAMFRLPDVERGLIAVIDNVTFIAVALLFSETEKRRIMDNVIDRNVLYATVPREAIAEVVGESVKF